jgi:hypothetical protein
VERAAALWEKSAANYECSAPHDTGSKAACVAARDALRSVAAEIRAMRGAAEPREPADWRIIADMAYEHLDTFGVVSGGSAAERESQERFFAAYHAARGASAEDREGT